jgi:hypothetical protein
LLGTKQLLLAYTQRVNFNGMGNQVCKKPSANFVFRTRVVLSIHSHLAHRPTKSSHQQHFVTISLTFILLNERL